MTVRAAPAACAIALPSELVARSARPTRRGRPRRRDPSYGQTPLLTSASGTVRRSPPSADGPALRTALENRFAAADHTGTTGPTSIRTLIPWLSWAPDRLPHDPDSP